MDVRIDNPSAVKRLARAAAKTFRREVTADGTMKVHEEALTRLAEVARRHATLRAQPVNAGILVAWTAFRNLIRGLQALDDVVVPEWRAQEVQAPVFLVANARSGTTLLHHLMSLDEERFVTMKLFETIFPSVTAHRIIDAIARSDEDVFGGFFGKLKTLTDRTFFSGWKDIHPLGLERTEEDECVFCYTLHTTTLGLLIPEIDEIEDLMWFDSLPVETRDAFLAYYENVIRRHVFSRAPEKRYLNKNVFMTPRLRSLAEHFPDAQFVYLVRHPYESIGSYLDMFHRAWAVHRPDVKKNSPEAKALARMAMKQYRYAMTCRDVMDREKFILVKYDDLVSNPQKTVERIYKELRIPLTPAYRARLVEATNAHREFKSEHDYDLEDFGVTREEVYEELKDIFQELGFSR
jgi:omega-hydroxy-beta-dihydromenaquinone-9 sulfotransferase